MNNFYFFSYCIFNNFTILNLRLELWLAWILPRSLNQFNNIHAFRYFTKNNMFFIKPTCSCSRDKKLASICIRSSICHCQASLFKFKIKILVFKSSSFKLNKIFLFKSTVNRFASSTILICEITSLNHKVRNNSMKWWSFVTKWCALGIYLISIT